MSLINCCKVSQKILFSGDKLAALLIIIANESHKTNKTFPNVRELNASHIM